MDRSGGSGPRIVYGTKPTSTRRTLRCWLPLTASACICPRRRKRGDGRGEDQPEREAQRDADRRPASRPSTRPPPGRCPVEPGRTPSRARTAPVSACSRGRGAGCCGGAGHGEVVGGFVEPLGKDAPVGGGEVDFMMTVMDQTRPWSTAAQWSGRWRAPAGHAPRRRRSWARRDPTFPPVVPVTNALVLDPHRRWVGCWR
jgi:hypothetical protein